MTTSKNQRIELGNGLSVGGTPYPLELRFGELSETERQKFIQTATNVIAELTSHRGVFFERHFGKNLELFLQFLFGMAPYLFLFMAIPLLDSMGQILGGAHRRDASDWIRFALLTSGYILNAGGLMIASSSVHTQDYWSKFLTLVNDPKLRDYVNFTPERPLPRFHRLSGWLQTWGILAWFVGFLFWAA